MMDILSRITNNQDFGMEVHQNDKIDSHDFDMPL